MFLSSFNFIFLSKLDQKPIQQFNYIFCIDLTSFFSPNLHWQCEFFIYFALAMQVFFLHWFTVWYSTKEHLTEWPNFERDTVTPYLRDFLYVNRSRVLRFLNQSVLVTHSSHLVNDSLTSLCTFCHKWFTKSNKLLFSCHAQTMVVLP